MEKKWSIRDLKHKIILERQVRRDDDLGGFFESWEREGTFWAALEPLPFSQHFRGRKEKGKDFLETRYELRVRCPLARDPFLKLWTGPLRFLWGDHILKPLSMPHLDSSHRWVKVLAVWSPSPYL